MWFNGPVRTDLHQHLCSNAEWPNLVNMDALDQGIWLVQAKRQDGTEHLFRFSNILVPAGCRIYEVLDVAHNQPCSLFTGPASRMPPKFDPNETKVIYVRAVGGEIGATSTLAPKVGPLGLNAKKVGEDIMKCSKDWKGLRVTVKLSIKNRQASAELVPSSTSLVLRALKEPPRDRKKVKNIKHTGNIPLEEIINIARIMRPRSLARELKGTVKEILGSAYSTGCNVDGRSPKDVSDDIASGEVEIPEK